MNWTKEVRAILARHTSTPDDDVVLELTQHAEAAWHAALAEGVTADRAAADVRGLVEHWSRDAVTVRRPRRPPIVEPPRSASHGVTGLLLDVRHACRLLRRQPGAAAIVVLVTGLGIGAAATLFSLVYGVLIRPLPWPDAARLVQAAETRDGATRNLPNLMTNATFLAWRDHPATVERVLAFTDHAATLTGAGDAERARIANVSASMFPVLGVAPIMGAAFTDRDETPGDAHVVVISYGLWQRRFGGRPDVIGQSIEIDGVPHTVTGVMPRAFFFPDPADAAWKPFYVEPVLSADPNMRSLTVFSVIAKLRPGATAEQAAAEATARSRTAPDLGMVGVAVFGTKGAATVTVEPYLAALTADVRPALIVLFASVGLLFVGVVANVAGMQIARSIARRREMAIRAALGAGSARLARQLITENLIIGLLAGVVGIATALALHRALPSLLPPDFPRLRDVAVDWRVTAFAIGAAMAASVAFGLVPAWLTRRLNLVEALTEDGLAPVGGHLRTRVSRARALIMTAQVAVSALLLVGAVLLARSFVGLLRIDRGFEPHNVLTAELPLPDSLYTGARRAQLVDRLLERLHGVPGVTHAAATTVLPLTPRDVMMGFRLPPRPGSADADVSVQTALRVVSPDYFDALGVRVVQGRAFDASDTAQSQRVAVVNRTFARRYFNDSALAVTLPADNHKEITVVGVIDDVRGSRATDPPQPELYLDYRQTSAIDLDTPTIVMRTTGDPAALAQTVRALVREQDPSIALQSIVTMDSRLDMSLARPRLYAIVLAAFAGLGLLVSGLGLFGVLSYTVSQRAREIGVRSALGARPRDIVTLILRQGLAVTVAGLVAGLATAFVLSRNLGSLLYGITPGDPITFAAVTIALLSVAALACYVPARRAARLDPRSSMIGER